MWGLWLCFLWVRLFKNLSRDSLDMMLRNESLLQAEVVVGGSFPVYITLRGTDPKNEVCEASGSNHLPGRTKTRWNPWCLSCRQILTPIGRNVLVLLGIDITRTSTTLLWGTHRSDRCTHWMPSGVFHIRAVCSTDAGRIATASTSVLWLFLWGVTSERSIDFRSA